MHTNLILNCLRLISAIAMAGSIAACHGTPPAVILQTSQPISVDGILDEPAWASAQPIPIVFPWGDSEPIQQAPHGVARLTWDDDYFYIGYEVFDTDLSAGAATDNCLPRQPCAIRDGERLLDVVEFLIAFDDIHFIWEIHHNVTNQFSDIWICAVDDDWPIAASGMAYNGLIVSPTQFIRDADGAKLATAARVSGNSTINRSADIDEGYFGELRLPWRGIGAPKRARIRKVIERDEQGQAVRSRTIGWNLTGQTVRVLVVMQDQSIKNRYLTSSPTIRPNEAFHTQVQHWPRYLFQSD